MDSVHIYKVLCQKLLTVESLSGKVVLNGHLASPIGSPYQFVMNKI